MSQPFFSQGGIGHGGFPLGPPEGGDIHSHQWYDKDGDLLQDKLTVRLPGGIQKHIDVMDHNNGLPPSPDLSPSGLG